MKAMLLAAGQGERMRPLTLTQPKPAVPVLGRPMAMQLLSRMARAGVREAVVNLHHLPDRVRSILEGGAEAGLPQIRFSHEERLLGTGGGIRKAAAMLRGDGPILLQNSDSLSSVDLTRVLAAHRASGHSATLVLASLRPGYSAVDVDERGRVLALAGAPAAPPEEVRAQRLFTGCHIIDEDVLERIPEGVSDIVRDVYRRLAQERRLGSYLHEGFWWEFGTPEQYLNGSLLLIGTPVEQRLAVADHDPVRPLDRGWASIGAAVEFHATARFEGNIALGFASRVAEDTVLQDSVVMPEAWIGPRCRLSRVIVAQGVEVPAGTSLERAMICTDGDPRYVPPPSVLRKNGLLICPFDGAG